MGLHDDLIVINPLQLVCMQNTLYYICLSSRSTRIFSINMPNTVTNPHFYYETNLLTLVKKTLVWFKSYEFNTIRLGQHIYLYEPNLFYKFNYSSGRYITKSDVNTNCIHESKSKFLGYIVITCEVITIIQHQSWFKVNCAKVTGQWFNQGITFLFSFEWKKEVRF